MKRVTRIFVLLSAVVLWSTTAIAHNPTALRNATLQVTISDTGSVESVENRLASETYTFSTDVFVIDTNHGEFSNVTTKPMLVRADEQQVEYHYEFGTTEHLGKVGVSLVYTLGPENAFFRRRLIVTNNIPLRLRNVILGKTSFSTVASEVVHYVTFIAAPTVEFIRRDKGGMFTGIENPFFKADLSKTEVKLSFDPGLILKAGEGYTSEPQFVGVYSKSGVMMEDSGRPFRYDSNGSGYKPLDRNEMRAMRAFALEYLNPEQKTFLNINYEFFHPLPQMPRNEDQKSYFTKTIDTFAEIGGDMIIFKPLHPYMKPDINKSLWDVVQDDRSQTARQIADYARDKGLGYGFYMGCAAHGKEGNAGGLPFRPDKPEWKKSDSAGRRACDNCLACDEYFKWWFEVQNNTIQKYNLSNWSWDPSLGSGMNCYDESHGHIAGQGGYKGWRNCIELMSELKAAKPGLFIQGFYGTKNYGLWGLKHVDQCEVYNEQTIIVSTKHHQISDDRQNADGLRFQNNWSMRFRFTPAVIGHALVHRISEGGFDPELIKAWDFAGWQYSYMSALAVSGSVMPTILPYEASLVPGYVEFYKKWQRWAKKNFEYVNYTEPFGEQVQPGAVDAYSRIKGDHGFIFLFNGNPRASEISFEVGDEINLQVPGRYEFAELYPTDAGKVVLAIDGKSVFSRGETARIVVPANACFLLELKKVETEKRPLLIGGEGTVTQFGDIVAITGVSGKPGQRVPMRVRLDVANAAKRLTVNGTKCKFTVSGNEIAFDVQFSGEAYVRELDSWILAGGERFDLPNQSRQQDLRLTTNFVLSGDVPQLLKKAEPKNFSEMGGKIATWQKARGVSPSFSNTYSYHNFVGERPERLWLIVPFLSKTSIELELNGRKVTELMWDEPSDSAFADITDYVVFGGENQLSVKIDDMGPRSFMGPYLLYPEESSTNDVLPWPSSESVPLVYHGALVPRPATRYQRDAGPVVTDAKMMANVTLTRKAELRVKVNLPTAKVRRVMFFESGFRWMGQHPLKYDKDAQCWVGLVEPGERDRIQENEDIYVWAEGTDGLRSEYYPVKVGWDFVK